MQKRSIGDFFWTIALWLVIGALVQWLMQGYQVSGQEASGLQNAMGQAAAGDIGSGDDSKSGLTTYWNALVVVALFFSVLAFLMRDLLRENPVARLSRVIGVRLLGTTFDIGLFALGGTLFLLWGTPAEQSTVPQWQALFIGIGLPWFIAILAVLGAIQALLKYSRASLLDIPALEFRPMARIGLYLGLMVLLALVAWLAI
ncbi:hypothetical protein [Kushneria phosphatilytica]|uniref:Uncharacterized protein n=1 Tax=Kushneria phosphatilytica TaxID=657387 RepID=A0A1S1NY81_9GAMM|nr:hypothetical protein [Kushneria phosphatilytica]OHV12847.1 hypothetical protein BH688_02095 [Kushneria phosphatilytica]QEL10698.1 hypothetical protein FY550_05865 [Kushneria phosphatilytica]